MPAICHRRNTVAIMHAHAPPRMMNFIRANKSFTPSALYALGALLCLCFSTGLHSHKSSKAFPENLRARVTSGAQASISLWMTEPYAREAAPTRPEEDSSSFPRRGAAKSIIVEAQFSIRGAMRDKHSPAHPSNLPPEPFTRLSISSPSAPLNSLADVRSLIFLSPLQNRAPPRFVWASRLNPECL
jgi:hypothetical protein